MGRHPLICGVLHILFPHYNHTAYLVVAQKATMSWFDRKIYSVREPRQELPSRFYTDAQTRGISCGVSFLQPLLSLEIKVFLASVLRNGGLCLLVNVVSPVVYFLGL